jgi:hypothetical protein
MSHEFSQTGIERFFICCSLWSFWFLRAWSGGKDYLLMRDALELAKRVGEKSQLRRAASAMQLSRARKWRDCSVSFSMVR